MDLTLFILLLSFTGVSVAVTRNLHCTNGSYEICDGQEVTCFCTAASTETIHWWPLPIRCSITRLCDSCGPEFTSVAHAEVIDCPSCSDNFTSRLRYNVSLGMESCRKDIEIGCFITPEAGSMSAPIETNTCSLAREPSDLEQNFIITKLVTNCTAPGPPRNLQSVIEGAQCNSELRNVTITWEAPQLGPSQLPVTNYSLTCTSVEGDSCSETLPADTTSYNLTVMAGVQYTITVSALSNDRESCFNPHLNFTPIKVVSDNVADNNATIEVQSGNFTSNLTITYGLCSEASSWTTMQFSPPVVHLVNLTADTMYCYSITSDGNITTGSCYGAFSTSSTTKQGCSPGNLWNLLAADANFLSDVSLLNDTASRYPSCDAGSVGSAVLVNTTLATVAYYNGTTAGSRACFVCDESSGYELNTTINERVCLSDGTWSGSPIACDITQAILSTGSIVAIVVSTLVGILVVIILVVFCCVKRAKGTDCVAITKPDNRKRGGIKVKEAREMEEKREMGEKRKMGEKREFQKRTTPSETSLHEAAEQGNLDAVKHLVQNGTDIDTKDELGMTALHKAAEGGHMHIVRYLVENEADIGIQERIGRTPLHVAAEEGHTNIVEYLINQEADIVSRDMSKRTPLHVAVLKGQMDTVRCLVNKGAIINTTDETGRTPQDVATGEGHEDIAEYLKEARETVV